MRSLRGWTLTGMVVAGLIAWAALVFGVLGWNEPALRLVVRGTARTAVVLFMLAFGAAALRTLWPSAPARWLRSNRRYLGVGFAAAHYLHLGGLVALAIAFPDPFVQELDVTIAGGVLAYAFIGAMALTSFDRTAAWLGPKRWRVLHTVGGYYVWVVFARAYITRAVEDVYFVPFALALVGVLGLRIAARRRRAVRLAAPPV